MKVSVAMASYNGERYIAEQIKTILVNLSDNDELVISDDGSTDKTKAIVKGFKDKRIKLIDGPKNGVKQNFANAIEHCSGDVIFLSDQDDIWEKNKVVRVLAAFRKNKCSLVVHDCEVFDSGSGEIIEKSFFKWRGSRAGILKNIWKNSYIGCCMAFKKEMKKYILPIPDDIKMHDQWIGVICEKYGKSYFLPEVLLRYRRHEKNQTEMKHDKFKEMLRSRAIFMQEYRVAINKARDEEEMNRIAKKRKDFHIFGELFRKGEFTTIIKKVINRLRIANVSHREVDNDFCQRECGDGKSKPRIVVYTCITDGYDKLIQPTVTPKNIDYVLFTDVRREDCGIWKCRMLPEDVVSIHDKVLENRYIKMHPSRLFGGKYDYAIYIDGNIGVLDDLTPLAAAAATRTGLALHRHRQRSCVYDEAKTCMILGKGNKTKMKKQIRDYRKNGFPSGFGLYEGNVIVTDLNNRNTGDIFEKWWKEFIKAGSLRDQLSLPYVIWEAGYDFDDVGSLGNNVYRSPFFAIAETVHEKTSKGAGKC